MTAEDKQEQEMASEEIPALQEDNTTNMGVQLELWHEEVLANLPQVTKALMDKGILKNELEQAISMESGTAGSEELFEALGDLESDQINTVLEILGELGMAATLTKFSGLQAKPELPEVLESCEEQKPAITEPVVRPYQDVIEECSGTFIDCMKPTTQLLSYLQVNSVLNNDMMLKIQCRPNRQDKVRVLLRFLKTLGPHSLLTFIDALRANDQNFLANILAASNFT